MRSIVRIVEAAGPGCLVLLDELGAGTDPTEGSALAQALLDHFIRAGALVVATTHYAELKTYAHNDAAARNASVEFDLETLSPTYRLPIGLPGTSQAFAIAERLGLPHDARRGRAVAPRPRRRSSSSRRWPASSEARDQAEAATVRAEAAEAARPRGATRGRGGARARPARARRRLHERARGGGASPGGGPRRDPAHARASCAHEPLSASAARRARGAPRAWRRRHASAPAAPAGPTGATGARHRRAWASATMLERGRVAGRVRSWPSSAAARRRRCRPATCASSSIATTWSRSRSRRSTPRRGAAQPRSGRRGDFGARSGHRASRGVDRHHRRRSSGLIAATGRSSCRPPSTCAAPASKRRSRRSIATSTRPAWPVRRG